MIKRIIQIRKRYKLSQERFAERLGLSRNFINQVENGSKNISDRTISDICREFNVNEEWLRNGTGEIFNKETTFSLDDYAKNNNLTEIEKKLIVGFMRLDPEVREAVCSVLENTFSTAQEQNNVYNEAPDTPEELEKLYPPIDIDKLNSHTG